MQTLLLTAALWLAPLSPGPVAWAAKTYCESPPSIAPNCVPNCLQRSNAGKCLASSNDFCGPLATCVPQCLMRTNEGACTAYRGDYCGRRAHCTPHCLQRQPDGKCLSYTGDDCAQESEIATCFEAVP